MRRLLRLLFGLTTSTAIDLLVYDESSQCAAAKGDM